MTMVHLVKRGGGWLGWWGDVVPGMNEWVISQPIPWDGMVTAQWNKPRQTRVIVEVRSQNWLRFGPKLWWRINHQLFERTTIRHWMSPSLQPRVTTEVDWIINGWVFQMVSGEGALQRSSFPHSIHDTNLNWSSSVPQMHPMGTCNRIYVRY